MALMYDTFHQGHAPIVHQFAINCNFCADLYTINIYIDCVQRMSTIESCLS